LEDFRQHSFSELREVRAGPLASGAQRSGEQRGAPGPGGTLDDAGRARPGEDAREGEAEQRGSAKPQRRMDTGSLRDLANDAANGGRPSGGVGWGRFKLSAGLFDRGDHESLLRSFHVEESRSAAKNQAENESKPESAQNGAAWILADKFLPVAPQVIESRAGFTPLFRREPGRWRRGRFRGSGGRNHG
jgi:hypothetical protein